MKIKSIFNIILIFFCGYFAQASNILYQSREHRAKYTPNTTKSSRYKTQTNPAGYHSSSYTPPTKEDLRNAEIIIDDLLEPDLKLLKEGTVTYNYLKRIAISYLNNNLSEEENIVLIYRIAEFSALSMDFDSAIRSYNIVDLLFKYDNKNKHLIEISSQLLKLTTKENAETVSNFIASQAYMMLKNGSIEDALKMLNIIKKSPILSPTIKNNLFFSASNEYLPIARKKENEILKIRRLLDTSPTDSELCYQYALGRLDYTRDLEESLHYFIDGSDSLFAKYAKLEVNDKVTSYNYHLISDYYWDLSEKKGPVSQIYKARAVKYYKNSIRDSTGIRKSLERKRIKEFEDEDRKKTEKLELCSNIATILNNEIIRLTNELDKLKKMNPNNLYGVTNSDGRTSKIFRVSMDMLQLDFIENLSTEFSAIPKNKKITDELNQNLIDLSKIYLNCYQKISTKTAEYSNPYYSSYIYLRSYYSPKYKTIGVARNNILKAIKKLKSIKWKCENELAFEFKKALYD